MKKPLKFGFGILILATSMNLNAQTWTTVTTDGSGDGSDPTLLDGTEFSYYYSKPGDSLYFKIDVTGFTATTEAALGVNVMINIPGGGATFNFWGNDNMNPFHKLLTTWVTGAPPSSYSGTIGVTDASGVSSANYTTLSSNNISIEVDNTSNEIILGIDRADLITDSEMGGDEVTVTAAAAVGSNMFWNDDIVTGAGTITIDKTTVPTGLDEKSKENSLALSIYPNPAVDQAVLSYVLQEKAAVKIELFDITGRNVGTLLDAQQERGKQQLPVNMKEISNGTYFITISVNDELISTKQLVK